MLSLDSNIKFWALFSLIFEIPRAGHQLETRVEVRQGCLFREENEAVLKVACFDHAGYFDFSLPPRIAKCSIIIVVVWSLLRTQGLYFSSLCDHIEFLRPLWGFPENESWVHYPQVYIVIILCGCFFICRMCVVWLPEAGLHPPPLYSSIERIKFSRRHVPCARRVGLLCRCAVSVVPLSLFRRPDYGHTLPRVFINTETPFPSFALTRCELYILKQNLDFACKKKQRLPALLVVGSRYVSNLLYYRNLWHN